MDKKLKEEIKEYLSTIENYIRGSYNNEGDLLQQREDLELMNRAEELSKKINEK